ncbi:hypothetical protein DFH06DRAFT_1350726 [Mycena polygramma]|nr:hypothetical protein DFH06DRAFT_1350726 [Mycena polygramma]
MNELKSGKFTIDPVKYENFKTSVRKLDSQAEFLGDANVADIRSIRHSKCGRIVKGKQPYEVSRFRAHVQDPKGCRIVHRGAGMSTLTSIFAGVPPSKPEHNSLPVVEKPCPGITEDDIPNVEKYLRRSGAMGGGSRSVFKIARQKFGKASRRKEVQHTQYHEQKWRNDHQNLRVFSTDCKKTVSCRGARPCACSSCSALLSSKASKPLGKGSATAEGLDFDYLVELRRRHQTVQAACGVRTRMTQTTEKSKEVSLHQQLIKKFHLALKEEQDRAIGTGLVRNAHWTAPAPGGRGTDVPGTQSAGNAANAALSATVVAKKAALKRKDVFTKAGVSDLADIITARVTIFRPIRLGDYGVVLTTRGLMIGCVFGMHSKGGGKYGKHEPVTDSTNISALSKISVQLFEKLHGTQSRSIPSATAILQTKQFAHVPPINFLCLLSAVPKLLPTGLELGADDSERFKKLSMGLNKFDDAIKLSRKRGKKTAATGVESDSDDGDI